MSSNILRIERSEDDFPKNYKQKMIQLVDEQFKLLRKNITKRILEENILSEKNDYKIQNNKVNVHKCKCQICNIDEIYGDVYQCLICDDKEFICEKCSNKHEHPMIRIY